MPAGQSLTGVFNIALLELGENPCQSPDDPRSMVVKLNTRWPDVRQAVIREFNWNCCKRYAQLASNPTPPAFGWDRAYDLPADYIRHYAVLDRDGNALDDAEWEVVGDQLYTDEGAPLNIQYFFDLADPTQYDALMTQVLGYRLAIAVTRDDEKIATIEKKLATVLTVARLTASQENSTKEWDTGVLLRSRR